MTTTPAPAEKRRGENDTTHGTLPGDPRKAAAAIITAVESTDTQELLVIHSDATTAYANVLQPQLASLETWRASSDAKTVHPAQRASSGLELRSGRDIALDAKDDFSLAVACFDCLMCGGCVVEVEEGRDGGGQGSFSCEGGYCFQPPTFGAHVSGCELYSCCFGCRCQGRGAGAESDERAARPDRGKCGLV